MNGTTQITPVSYLCDSLCGAACGCHCEVTAAAATESSRDSSPSVAGAYVIASIALVIALAGGYLLWKIAACQKKALAALRSQIQDYEEQLSQVKKVSSLQADSVKETPPTIATKADHASKTTNKTPAMHKGNVSPPSTITTRYGTLRAPDEQGQLCFAERTMVDTPTKEKMFLLELNLTKGEGTYRLNRAAISTILNDLQTFQNFVKPFSFSGTASSANITDKKVGRVVRKDNFWVVSELLEITIK